MNVSKSLFLEAGVTFRFFLEIYTRNTYADVVSYVIHEQKYDMYTITRKKKSGSRIFCMDLNKVAGKNCSGDSD